MHVWCQDASSLHKNIFFSALSFTSEFYRRFMMRRLRRAQHNQSRLPAHVISVGNLVAGGTGKTPFAIWLAQFLQESGWKVAILSRGYGGKRKTASRVPITDETLLPVFEFGDEPVLMACKLTGVPVWTGHKRSLSGLAAIRENGSEVLVLDDGFQHLALRRDLDIVLLDSRNPFGNESLIPLGPLREPVDHLQRADIIILTRADHSSKANQTVEFINRRFPGKPIFSCRHRLIHFRWGLAGPEIPLKFLRRRRAFAFAGIARPDSFFHSLAASELQLAEKMAFPDHYFYKHADLLMLLKMLARSDADFLITTEKDAVRLPPEFRSLVLTARLELDFGLDEQDLIELLEARLGIPPKTEHKSQHPTNLANNSTPN